MKSKEEELSELKEQYELIQKDIAAFRSQVENLEEDAWELNEKLVSLGWIYVGPTTGWLETK
jgi:prefoldin subunit 5